MPRKMVVPSQHFTPAHRAGVSWTPCSAQASPSASVAGQLVTPPACHPSQAAWQSCPASTPINLPAFPPCTHISPTHARLHRGLRFRAGHGKFSFSRSKEVKSKGITGGNLTRSKLCPPEDWSGKGFWFRASFHLYHDETRVTCCYALCSPQQTIRRHRRHQNCQGKSSREAAIETWHRSTEKGNQAS